MVWKSSRQFSCRKCLNCQKWEIEKQVCAHWYRCINSMYHVFPGLKTTTTTTTTKTTTYQCLGKRRRFNYKPKLCQNAVLPLKEHSTNRLLVALSGHKQLSHGLCGQCLCEVARSWAIPSISGNDDTTSPYQTFKAWAMIVVLIPVYDIGISSGPRHKSASNWHALNYWLTYTMTDTYLLMVL